MESVIYNVDDGLQFERHDETGDVTVHMEGMTSRIPENVWISIIASMCAAGEQAAHADAKLFHKSIGTSV